MNRLGRMHIPWIKQLLVQKCHMDMHEHGHEIVFEQAVLDRMKQHGYTLMNIYHFLCDFPIVDLISLNRQNSRYRLEVSGTHGSHIIRIRLEMAIDRSGLDFKVVNLVIKH